MKILLLLFMVFLVGCSSNTVYETRSEYVVIAPPSFLLSDCKRQVPYNLTIQEVIVDLTSQVNICNSQIKQIREWIEREEQIYE